LKSVETIVPTNIETYQKLYQQPSPVQVELAELRVVSGNGRFSPSKNFPRDSYLFIKSLKLENIFEK